MSIPLTPLKLSPLDRARGAGLRVVRDRLCTDNFFLKEAIK
jgi:hypothetical protein